MSDLIDEPIEGENAPEFTVSEISGAVKKTIEGAFGRVRVRGEVGRIFKARSGHLYYDIKDDKSVLACTTWKGQVSQLSVVPEEGLEVIVTGRLTTFGAQSKYNLNVDMVEVAGEGALMAMLEKRKKALAAEGLFGAERKQKLPYLPDVIGVITSPSGAVVHDILHRLRDRFPRKVLIWPVAVQGKQCAAEVTRAIEGFNAMTPGGALPRPDLLIVARGGGSIEDLWGFNEEIVVRATAASEIPLISAVGHETDTTLIDFASDQRAPTPTAAAELAVPVRLELLAWVEEQEARLTRAATTAVDQRKQRLRDLARALPKPETLLDSPRQRLDRASERLPAALTRAAQIKRLRLTEVSGSLRPMALSRLIVEARTKLGERAARLTPVVLGRDIDRKKTNLTQVTARLIRVSQGQVDGWRNRLQGLERIRQTLGYKETLSRGYAVVRGDGDVVTSKAKAKKASIIEIEFADGRYEIGAAPARKPKADKPPSDQGSLF
ncbi:exodeoxyribonuclease VII large subunit [Marinosulfonomonas sp. PRT-SC04]|nr:exodeoxyribonuclease VII large subunit [Marinosulfonomonas sp. PRT-SC04]